jgi:hypothetical protein
MSPRFRAHQIVRLIEYASRELQITSLSKSIARAFEISHSAIACAALRGYEDPPGRGRHDELDADSEQELIAWIADKAVNNTVVNKTELLHECNKRFGKGITRGWVDSFVKRHAEELCETKSIPQENPRLEVPRAFLKQQ